MRAFAALPIPAEVRKDIQHFQQDIHPLIPDSSVRWTREEQWHITLHFFGEIDARAMADLPQQLAEVCEDHGGFRLRTTGLGVFPSPQRPSVLWIGFDDCPPLRNLQADLVQQMAGLGSSRETRTYHPHLTLARIRKPAQKTGALIRQSLASGIARPPIEWRADTVHLYESRLGNLGSSYVIKGSVKLRV